MSEEELIPHSEESAPGHPNIEGVPLETAAGARERAEHLSDDVAMRARELALTAVETARRLAARDADKEVKLAVDRALRDQAVDHTLELHTAHLQQINGSQAKMVEAQESMNGKLDSIETKVDTQIEVKKALNERTVTKRTLRIASVGVIFTTPSAVLALLAISGHLH